MNVLIDMNLSAAWVEILVAAGHNAVHWSSLGPANAPDDDIIAVARDNDYVLLTLDLDFSAILAASGEHWPSVLQVRAGNLRPAFLAPMVLAALQQGAADLRRGSVLTIVGGNLRVRSLPIADDNL